MVDSWSRVLFKGFKAHYCPDDLVEELVEDIENRGGSLDEIANVSDGGIDLPGMILVDRPWEDIQIDGFKLGIPSQDLGDFLSELERTPLRKFPNGKQYYKIHGWLVCVVFTPDQRNEVLRIMKDILPQSVKRADDATERMIEGLKRMEKAGVIMPKPDPPKGRN